MRPALIGVRAKAAAVPSTGTPMRFLRMRITSFVRDGFPMAYVLGDVRVQELSFRVGATAYPSVAMTTNTAPSPLVAFSSSSVTGFGDLEPWNAFNLSATGNQWQDAGNSLKFIGIDLGAGNAIRPDSVVVTPDNAVYVGGGYYITGFRIEGDTLSPSGGGFTGSELIYLTVTGLVQSDWTANTPKTFAIP